jgi:hypothetical protein
MKKILIFKSMNLTKICMISQLKKVCLQLPAEPEPNLYESRSRNKEFRLRNIV